VALAAVVCVLAAGCSHIDTLSYPTPPPTTATTTPTTLGNLAGIQMAAVGGTPAPLSPSARAEPASRAPSQAEWPGRGCRLHAERLVGDQLASIDAVSQPDGRWTIAGILGGRYRLRAWRAPDMALTVPQIFFLPEAGDRSVALELDQFGAGSATTAIDPTPRYRRAGRLGRPDHGAKRRRPRRGSDGARRGVSRAGGRVVLDRPDAQPGRTSKGRATWQVICGSAGPSPSLSSSTTPRCTRWTSRPA